MAVLDALPIAQPAARPETAANGKTAPNSNDTGPSFAEVLETEVRETEVRETGVPETEIPEARADAPAEASWRPLVEDSIAALEGRRPKP